MINFIQKIDSSTIAINGATINVSPAQMDRWIEELRYNPQLADRMESQAINDMIRESAKINR